LLALRHASEVWLSPISSSRESPKNVVVNPSDAPAESSEIWQSDEVIDESRNRSNKVRIGKEGYRSRMASETPLDFVPGGIGVRNNANTVP
jgi:hypothetical protein